MRSAIRPDCGLGAVAEPRRGSGRCESNGCEGGNPVTAAAPDASDAASDRRAVAPPEQTGPRGGPVPAQPPAIAASPDAAADWPSGGRRRQAASACPVTWSML